MSDRAVVLIGVARTGGGLPELQAVYDGLDAMAEWAVDQAIPDELVLVFSDRDGSPVTAGDITAGISKVVEEEASLTQLVIYFAGHGINNGVSEYWLLSGAPDNTNEAVNVAGTAMFAERLPIPHIVIISDACRTLPQGLLAAGISGSVIVPNVTPSGPMSAVDTFYACLLGAPAHEIADKDEAASVYRSLYTEVLVEALTGRYPEVVDAVESANAGDGAFVRPRPLKRTLPDLALRRLKEMDAYLTISQTPDAKVTSDDPAWLSRLATAGAGATRATRGSVTRGGAPVAPPGRSADPRPDGSGGDFATQVAMAVGEALDPPGRRTRGRGPAPPPEAFTSGAAQLADTFGPRHFETGVGVKVRGSAVVAARAVDGTPEVLSTELVRIEPDRHSDQGSLAATVVVDLVDGAILLPTLYGYFTVVTLQDHAVVDLAWEPMEWTERGQVWDDDHDAFQAVRSRLVMAMDMGVDPVEHGQLEHLASWAEHHLHLDPSVAVVTAWQVRDAGRRDLAVRLRNRVVEVFGTAPVDLELAADLIVPGVATAPPLPLLTRCWATYDVLADPHPAPTLSARRLPSTWSLYRREAVDELMDVATRHRMLDRSGATHD